jgi:hypothetical protein
MPELMQEMLRGEQEPPIGLVECDILDAAGAL